MHLSLDPNSDDLAEDWQTFTRELWPYRFAEGNPELDPVKVPDPSEQSGLTQGKYVKFHRICCVSETEIPERRSCLCADAA
ncbi:MAG: hypothetical protein M2R45_01570 [Verrucomicrobia subdivision 3 bacterium]|nr:hypothetical protein [Limisphaerales bacterium]MCS1413304.1 hypothetical protein [Limisphaerales bacterium]